MPDEHAPNKLRVNGPLMNFQPFATAYGISLFLLRPLPSRPLVCFFPTSAEGKAAGEKEHERASERARDSERARARERERHFIDNQEVTEGR